MSHRQLGSVVILLEYLLHVKPWSSNRDPPSLTCGALATLYILLHLQSILLTPRLHLNRFPRAATAETSARASHSLLFSRSQAVLSSPRHPMTTQHGLVVGGQTCVGDWRRDERSKGVSRQGES